MISVIIPAYNSQQSIERCLVSVLSQNNASFEVIVVDDGSTDKTLALCRGMEKLDSRLRVFHQSNQGASAARNYGMKQAQGEWIVFVDSDDQVSPNYLSRMCSCCSQSTDIDLYVGSLNVYRDGKKHEVLQLDSCIVNASDLHKIFGIIKLHKHGFSVAKMYRRSILEQHNIRFNSKVNMAEDCILMMNYILACGHSEKSLIYCDDEANYDYYVKSGSLSTRLGSYEQEYRNYEAVREIVHEIIKRIHRGDVRKELLSSVGWYGDRCINAIYITSGQNKDVRLKHIKQIDSSELTFRHDENAKQWMLKWLLKMGLYRLYDFMRC